MIEICRKCDSTGRILTRGAYQIIDCPFCKGTGWGREQLTAIERETAAHVNEGSLPPAASKEEYEIDDEVRPK